MSTEDNNRIQESTLEQLAEVREHLESIENLTAQGNEKLEEKLEKIGETNKLLEKLLEESKKKEEFEVSISPKDKLKLTGASGAKGDIGLRGSIGLQGPIGKIGKPGKDAKPPTKFELKKLIKPLIPDPIPGKDGTDGSPDTPIEIRDKLETLDGSYRLDAKAIKNLPSLVVGGNERRPFIKTVSDTASVDLAVAAGALSATVLPAGVDHNSLANLTTGDPHTQYRLESADHTHQSTGLQGGTLDHGLALTGLTDDDHTQYALLAGRSGGQTLIGGTGTTDDLTLRSTSGAGVSGSDIIFQQGNNGADEVARMKSIAALALATGGTITTDGAYTVHTFTSSGTFTPTSSLNVDYLVVAGGGSGGKNGGGGGGAGGFLTGTAFAVTAQAYTITVGAGGASQTVGGGGYGNAGSDSTFSTITATGGGRGGYYNNNDGGTGGSGGGGGAATSNGGAGTSGQGYAGGNASSGSPYFRSGGGGGASQAGTASSGATGGKGGDGTANSYSGASVTYAGGGSGMAESSAPDNGGAGGGGKGEKYTAYNATAGTANTGGGGGGGDANASGAGGSGIVIIRYLSGSNYIYGTGIGVSSPTAVLHLKAGTATANTAPLKFNSGTLLTTAEAGVVEFLTDKFYGTITTGAARAELTLNDAALTATRVPFATTNGRLTDDADMTFATDTLTVTKLAATTLTGLQTYADAVNMTFNATTGTKIGTATTQKLAFYNATPIVQPTGIIDADGTLADITTKFNALLAKLEALGLQAVA